MFWLNSNRMRLVLIGVIAVMVLGGGSAKADFMFGQPTEAGLPFPNHPSDTDWNCFSSDGLEVYGDYWSGDYTWDIWMAKRETVNDEWGIAVNLGSPINSPQQDAWASISSDGLELYFASNRPGEYGWTDIWVATRESKEANWATPINLGPVVNSASKEDVPRLSRDGMELYFSSNRPGGIGRYDIWVSKRETIDGPWGEPINLGAVVNSSSREQQAAISPDGLALFFWSDRPGGYGGRDLWMTKRAKVGEVWGTPVNLGPTVNSPANEAAPTLSADGLTLYFRSQGILYQTEILPIVDLNGDGNIDTSDLMMLIDSWGTDDTLYDIGPMPWGDGVVDIEDLKVFIKYWEQENMP